MNNKIEKVIDVAKIFEISDCQILLVENNPVKKSPEISDANLTDISESGLVWKFLSEDFRRENNIN